MLDMLKNSHFWRVWLPPHLFAITGLSLFPDWRVVLSFLFFYTLISGLGVAVGLHRYFSHKAFKTNQFWEQAMLFFGMLACHGNPLFWVALHRGLHHRFSDTDRDPHSPVTQSLWTSYQGYAFDPSLVDKVPVRAGADFLRHREWSWTFKHYHFVLWSVWICGLCASLLAESVWVMVGLVLAQVWAIHQEAIVNVFGHKRWFGAYQNYATDDHSVNRPLLGLFTWGQALHNNHHGDAGNPDFGSVRWYEKDPSMIWIGMIRNDA